MQNEDEEQDSPRHQRDYIYFFTRASHLFEKFTLSVNSSCQVVLLISMLRFIFKIGIYRPR